MPHRIPQSVALRVPLKAYLSSDHVSPATSKTIAVVISKNGAAFGNPSGGATNATEIGNGWYYVDLSTTDDGTLGPLVVRGTVASVDDVEIVYQVVDASSMGAAYLDAAISTRTKPADTQAAVTTVTNLTNAPTSGDFTATMKTSLSAATPAVTVSDKTGFSLTAAYDSAKTAAQAGDAMALTTGERTSMATAVWAATGRTLSSFGTLVADTATAVWGAATRTLSAFGFGSTVAVAVVDQTLSGHTTAGTVGGALNSASSAGDPWNTALPGAYAGGTAGSIVGTNLDATVSSRSSHTAADVWAVGSRTLTSFGTLVADAATAVWASVTRTLTAFNFTVSTASDSDVAAIKVKTDNLPAAPAAVSDIPTATANADALLGRKISGGANGGRTVTDALRATRNKVAISGTTLTVYAEDDVTVAWTATLTSDSAAQPIVGVDPA